MKREDKGNLVKNLTELINASNHFYLTDISDLNALDTSQLRRACFKKDLKLQVVKNTILKRALEASDKNVEELYSELVNSSSIIFSEQGSEPAKLIKEFRKKHKKPILKAAYVEESVYIGDNQLDILASIKTKNELIADVIALLQSPLKNVVSSLQSGSNILTGVLTTLSNKE
ncbi:MAG: 50S ribosomal protein L10 [Bacteroidales bacterium]|nr:50S ribosomal protein L10 [Bacteroidales bacterium]